LDAVHAFEAVGIEDWPPVLNPHRLEHRREAARQGLDQAVVAAVQRVAGAEGVDVRTHLLEGTPGECLLSLATRTALFVVGRRGGGALRRGLRGSVSATVLHHSWAPVALVPPDAPHVTDRWARSRVVVGVDGSPASLTALAWGVQQAQEWGSVLLPVVVSSLTGRAPAGLSERTPDLTAATWSAVREAGGQSLEVHPHFLEGSPSRALLSFVQPADLLVVGSRGRGGVSSLLLGSTSTTVAEQARCPVVVVREGQARREVHQRQVHELPR
jgi:nucleotide-binding universal stress UspA family protein